MRIRPAQVEDAAALARLHVDAWRVAYRGLVPDAHLRRRTFAWRKERFEKSLAAGAEETYVIQVDGQVQGFLTLAACRDPDLEGTQTGEIWGLYVAPDHWRRGLGTRLLQEGMRLLYARGHRQAILWVLEGNQQGRGFYEAMGFRPDGAAKTLDLGRPLKAIRYRKALAPDEGGGTNGADQAQRSG